MTRPRMIAINRKIHDMTTAEFGVEWMNGTKQKSRGTVEEMKMQSLRAENERLQEENERLQQETDSITAPVRRFLGSFKTDKEKRAADAAQQLAEAQEARKKAEEARAAAEEQAEKARRMAQEAAERAEGLKRDMEAMEKERAILEASKRDLAAKVKAGSQEIEKIRDYYGGLASGELGLDVRERGVITYLKKSGKYEAVQKEARNYFKAERGRASKAFAKKADEIERGGRKADKEADTRYS